MLKSWRVSQASHVYKLYEETCKLADKELVLKYVDILYNNPEDWKEVEYYKKKNEFVKLISEDHQKKNYLIKMNDLPNITEEEKTEFINKSSELDDYELGDLYLEYSLISNMRKLKIIN